MIRSRIASAFALAALIIASAPAAAQSTRSGKNTASGALFFSCGQRCITPQAQNAYNVDLNASVGFLVDANTWTALNNFAQSPTVPTPGVSDSSSKVPNTAWVMARLGNGVLPTTAGGTGVTAPALTAGANVTITGSWPNQTINAAGGSGLPGYGVSISGTTVSAPLIATSFTHQLGGL